MTEYTEYIENLDIDKNLDIDDEALVPFPSYLPKPWAHRVGENPEDYLEITPKYWLVSCILV